MSADNGGTEVPTTRKVAVYLNSDIKAKCLMTIVDFYIVINRSLKSQNTILDPEMLNISLGVQIANLLSSMFIIFKRGVTDPFDAPPFNINYMQTSYPIHFAQAFNLFKEVCTKNGLATEQSACLEEQTPRSLWISTMGPYIGFFTIFGLRLRETRLGRDEMLTSRRQPDVEPIIKISEFGLNRTHSILCEGITFPVERQFDSRILGPMTAVINYLESDKMYEHKYIKVAERALPPIPNIYDILFSINEQSRRDNRFILGLLADIILLVNPSKQRRMSPPLNVFAKLMSQLVETNPNIYQLMNFSGRPGFILYREACGVHWLTNTHLSGMEFGQIMFHCWFGTSEVDLGILASITNVQNWFSRSLIVDKFSQASQAPIVRVELPVLNYYGKMDSTSLTGLLPSESRQTASIPTFSGSRVRQFSSEFLAQVERHLSTGLYPNDSHHINSELCSLRQSLSDRIKNGELPPTIGTGVPWRILRTATLEVKGDSYQLNPNKTGHIFWE